MKAKPFQILLSLFLVASLLFTQVGVGFLHDKHDAHERIDKAQRDQTQLHKHGEHCKVCSIDMFFSLFIDNGVVTIDSTPKSIQTCITHDALQSQPLRFFEGRAPPAIAV